MYDRSSSVVSVNEARVASFTRKQRSYDLIPPTQGAFQEQAKQAAHQTGHIWGQPEA